ncbi:hypothetical protein [Exiguobacterium sp. s181]|uniref:hypothetical protein n=1 Tax=Exiguobacterium sp. s181 TaxID=2751288 RepID=UPI001BE6C4D7|nr:hypothetical protein [Exiguobacterium sp. s181]
MNHVLFKQVVPKDRLEHHINKEQIISPKNSIDAMYKDLITHRKSLVESIFQEYQFAGMISLNVFEIRNFPQEFNGKTKFLEQLKRKLKTSNVLNTSMKPEIDKVPQIDLIQEIENGLRIQWISGVRVEVADGYGIITRIDTRRVTTIIRFGSPLFIEVRAGYKASTTYLKLIQGLVSDDVKPLEFEKVPLTKVTEKETEEIARILKAGLLEGEHLGSNGIGRYAVSADRDTKDLRDLEEYKQSYMTKQYLAQTLNVYYEEQDSGYSTNVKFKVNMNGGFQFKTKVSEKIIKRIFDVFAEVRYKQVVTVE